MACGTPYGEWRALDRTGREEWLRRACTAYFDESRAHKSGTPGDVFTIDGEEIDDLAAFFCAMGEAVNGPGGYFGADMTSFDDCLLGRFGLEAPCTIVWKNADISRQVLDSAVLVTRCEACLEWIARTENPSDFEGERDWALAMLELAREGQRTMFDELVETIEGTASRGFGVVIDRMAGWQITLRLD